MTMVTALRWLLVLLAFLGTNALAHACSPALQDRIVGQYKARYHAAWGIASPRGTVDAVIDRLAQDIEPMLRSGANYTACRFSVFVVRDPPTTSPFGPKLSADAQTPPAILQIVSEGTNFCVGLNDKDHRMLPPNDDFPHEIRQLSMSSFGLNYTYYKLKCYAAGGFTGRYMSY